MRRLSAAVGLALLVLAPGSAVRAQPSAPGKGATDPDAEFIEYLRRQDPAVAERFIGLRKARDAALADLQQAAQRYSAGGTALRPVSFPALQQARRRYAEASLALLDFLDERDRATLARLEATAERLKADAARLHESLQERARARADIKKDYGE